MLRLAFLSKSREGCHGNNPLRPWVGALDEPSGEAKLHASTPTPRPSPASLRLLLEMKESTCASPLHNTWWRWWWRWWRPGGARWLGRCSPPVASPGRISLHSLRRAPTPTPHSTCNTLGTLPSSPRRLAVRRGATATGAPFLQVMGEQQRRPACVRRRASQVRYGVNLD